MAYAKRFPIPVECGGGDFIMRKSTAGEVEDSLKAAIPSQPTHEATAAAQLDSQSNLVCDAIEKFRGEDVPKRGKDRQSWWNALNGDEREFLLGIHDRLNTVKASVIDDFFAQGEVIRQ